MASMSELRAYKESQYHLAQRLMELRRLESKAHRGWTESKGAPGYLDQWTKAITRANETASTLAYLEGIIREIESE